MTASDSFIRHNVLCCDIRESTKRCCVNLVTADEHGDDRQPLLSVLRSQCPSLTDPEQAYMFPTPYLRGGEEQSIYPLNMALERDADTDIQYERELVTMDDNGIMSLDWYPGISKDSSEATPIGIIVTGYAGSSYERHIRFMAKWLADGPLAYRAVVMNYRGCSKTPMTSPKSYLPYDTNDFRAVISHVKTSYPNAPLVCIAYSLGGGLLTKYLGETGKDCPFAASVAISCLFDKGLVAKKTTIPGHFNDAFFNPGLINVLRRYYSRNMDVLTSSGVEFDMEAIKRAKNVPELDTAIEAKLRGASSVWELYKRLSCTEHVRGIASPFLAFHSLDDPLVPLEYIPVVDFKSNPHAALVVTEHGGHIGFATGNDAKLWLTTPIAEFFSAFV